MEIAGAGAFVDSYKNLGPNSVVVSEERYFDKRYYTNATVQKDTYTSSTGETYTLVYSSADPMINYYRANPELVLTTHWAEIEMNYAARSTDEEAAQRASTYTKTSVASAGSVSTLSNEDISSMATIGDLSPVEETPAGEVISDRSSLLDQTFNKDSLMFSTSKLPAFTDGNVPEGPNKNKVVNIQLRPINSSQEHIDASWRRNLSRIYTEILGRDTLLGSDMLDLRNSFDVKDNVVLTLDSFPKIGSNNEWTTASEQVSEVVSEVKSFIDTAKGNDKTNEKSFFNTLSNMTKKGTSLLAMGVGTISSLSDMGGQDFAAPGRILQPWSLNVPVWKGSNSSNHSFTLNFKFNMGQYGLWNAYEEVYKPAINLVAPVMMRNNGHLFADGSGPNVFTLLAQAFENILDGEKTIFDETGFFNKLEEFVIQQYTGYVYEVSLGSFVNFTNVIFTNGDITWGTEVDNYGYPTSANVSIKLQTMTPMALNNSSSLALAIRYGGMNS